jgi:hypothetical protein
MAPEHPPVRKETYRPWCGSRRRSAGASPAVITIVDRGDRLTP